MSGNPLIFEEPDWNGRPVRLYRKSWAHALQGHPELEEQEDAVRRSITDPHLVTSSTTHVGREVCSHLGACFTRSRLWMRVPIAYAGQENVVITAYLTPEPPRGTILHVRRPTT